MQLTSKFCILWLLVIFQELIVQWSAVFGIAINNGVVGIPVISCQEDRITIKAKTQVLFTGKIFVKGKSKDPQCSKSFLQNDNSEAQMTILLGDCGMQRLRRAAPKAMNFMITLVISFHPIFITKVDRAYRARCAYMETEKTLTASLDVSMIPTTDLAQSMAMPTCTYAVKVKDPEGSPAKFVNVGDPVYHVWQCDGPDMGILVRNCFVNSDSKDEKVAVVDENGCPLDPILINQVTYDHGVMKAVAESHVFKYADTNSVYFSCEIKLCQKVDGGCNGLTPPVCKPDSTFRIYKTTRQPPVYVPVGTPTSSPAPAPRGNDAKDSPDYPEQTDPPQLQVYVDAEETLATSESLSSEPAEDFILNADDDNADETMSVDLHKRSAVDHGGRNKGTSKATPTTQKLSRVTKYDANKSSGQSFNGVNPLLSLRNASSDDIMDVITPELMIMDIDNKVAEASALRDQHSDFDQSQSDNDDDRDSSLASRRRISKDSCVPLALFGAAVGGTVIGSTVLALAVVLLCRSRDRKLAMLHFDQQRMKGLSCNEKYT